MLADLRAQAESMSGAAALPRTDDGEPVFDEPWQGRLVAITIETVATLGVSWEVFRTRLIAEIDADPHRSYYASWLEAFETLVAANDLADAAQLTAERMTAAAYRTTEQHHDDLEVFPLPVDEATLLAVLTALFEHSWRSIRFGTRIPGSVQAVTISAPPTLSILDGHLSIDWGGSRLRLCIGEPAAPADRSTGPELGRTRRCANAELQRHWVGGAPVSWMFRMYNGDGDQQLTVLLPNPFLADDASPLPEPDWSRLDLWDRLRQRHLGLPADPADRSATEFVRA